MKELLQDDLAHLAAEWGMDYQIVKDAINRLIQAKNIDRHTAGPSCSNRYITWFTKGTGQKIKWEEGDAQSSGRDGASDDDKDKPDRGRTVHEGAGTAIFDAFMEEEVP